MMPIMLNRLSVMPATKRPPSAPTIEKGSASITDSGCTKLSNCAASTM
jgi:hypothetical protein